MRPHSVTLEYRIDLSKLYRKVANDLYRMSPYLQCQTCRKQRGLTPGGIADHLRNGWPKCCDETMHLMTDTPTNQQIAYQGA